MEKYLKILMSGIIAVCVALVSCTSDDDKNDNIYKPIEKHILGKWKITKSMMYANGKWTEDATVNGIDGSEGVTMTFHNDGTFHQIYPTIDTIFNQTVGQFLPDGIYVMNSDTWKVDDATNRLIISDMAESEIFKLTDSEFEWGMRAFVNNERQEMKYVCIRMDMDRKSLIEKLVGKWSYIYSNEKTDGKWIKTDDAGNPDQMTYELRPDGTCSIDSYTQVDNNYLSSEGLWGVSLDNTCLFQKYGTDSRGGYLIAISMPDDDTLIFTYTIENDEGIVADFQDVFKRIS